MQDKRRVQVIGILGSTVVLVAAALSLAFYRHRQEHPSGLRLVDLGSPAVPGAMWSAGGECFEMRASGIDIWMRSDEGSFACRPLRGDARIELRVGDFQGGKQWAKVGIMLRASLDPDSAHVFFEIINLTNGVYRYEVVWRASSGEMSRKFQCKPGKSLPFAPAGADSWLRLERQGKKTTVFSSPNGRKWRKLWTGDVDLPERYLAGVALTSHDEAAVAVAKICDLAFTEPSP